MTNHQFDRFEQLILETITNDQARTTNTSKKERVIKRISAQRRRDDDLNVFHVDLHISININIKK